MKINKKTLQDRLCQILCAEVQLIEKGNDLLMVETPFSFSDGDPYLIYLKELPTGNLRMSDCGHTFMHLSYENDIDKFRDGTRGKVFQGILSEMDINDSEGELYLDFPPEKLGMAVFRFGQALTKINDLTFLNRARAESTFYDDLYESILKTVSEDIISRDYIYNDMPNAADYPVDYRIEGKNNPLFVFGIPTKDKARLATIVLEHLIRENAEFESLLIFQDQGSIPKPDLARLSNVGGEMIASLDAQDDMHRKLARRILN